MMIKTMIKKTFALILALVTVLCLFSCNKTEEGYVTRNTLGLTFTIPEEFEEREVGYADICYINNKVYFFVNVFTKEQITEELEIAYNISIERYTEKFLYWNDYDAEYVYDAERNASTFNVTVTNDDGTEEYYHHFITRNENVLYVVIMTCPVEQKETWISEFDKWTDSLSIKS